MAEVLIWIGPVDAELLPGMSFRRLIVLVFLPFATGYYLSYLYHTINALIAEQLSAPLVPFGGILVWDDVKIDHFVMAITSAEAIVL